MEAGVGMQESYSQVAFERYRRLLKAGYEDETPNFAQGSVTLLHPSPAKVVHPELSLFPDGAIATHENSLRLDRLRIEAHETARLEAFLLSTRGGPRWGRRMAVPRWIILVAALFIAYALLRWRSGLLLF